MEFYKGPLSGSPQGSLSEDIAKENEQLVESIAIGSPEAEREFVQRYLGPVRAMLSARSRNADWAADIQQDVMIEAICALRRRQLQDSAKLTSFVLAIARNLLNNHFRTSSRTVSLELPDDLPEVNSKADRLEEQEWEGRALTAISSLDAVDRNILQMTLLEGMKPGMIAGRLRMSPDVVRQRKLRATRRVIEIVQGASQKRVSSHLPAEGAQ